MAQANKKVKRLENELRETKAELEASGPGLRAAAPSPVQSRSQSLQREINNELETELRHSLNKAEAHILSLHRRLRWPRSARAKLMSCL